MSPITTKKHGDVLIVTSNNPPVNALSHAVREGLVKAIEQADSDEAVKAVVILCQGQTFFGWVSTVADFCGAFGQIAE